MRKTAKSIAKDVVVSKQNRCIIVSGAACVLKAWTITADFSENVSLEIKNMPFIVVYF